MVIINSFSSYFFTACVGNFSSFLCALVIANIVKWAGFLRFLCIYSGFRSLTSCADSGSLAFHFLPFPHTPLDFSVPIAHQKLKWLVVRLIYHLFSALRVSLLQCATPPWCFGVMRCFVHGAEDSPAVFNFEFRGLHSHDWSFFIIESVDAYCANNVPVVMERNVEQSIVRSKIYAHIKMISHILPALRFVHLRIRGFHRIGFVRY